MCSICIWRSQNNIQLEMLGVIPKLIYPCKNKPIISNYVLDIEKYFLYTDELIQKNSRLIWIIEDGHNNNNV